ncbi:MAG TPA: hypothetical protein VNX29_01855 [Kaistia sp.]|nr:hypothetical protein [Kaistia sp.]
MAITNAQFARSAARLAKVSAAWAGDILELDRDAGESAPAETVRRFISEMRKRLDWLENDLDPPPQMLEATRDVAASTGEGWRVKALGWKRLDDGRCYASSILTTVYFAHPDGSWCFRDSDLYKAGTDLDAAKAAAQTDYEARIRTAIEPAPPALEVGEKS